MVNEKYQGSRRWWLLLGINLGTVDRCLSSFSWPCCVPALFSLNCLKVTISEFLYNLLLVSYGDNEKKKKKLCTGLEIKPQTALISLRFVQTAANSSDRRSRRANQPVKNIYRWFAPLFWILSHMTDCLPTRPAMPLCTRLKHSPHRSVSLPACSQ